LFKETNMSTKVEDAIWYSLRNNLSEPRKFVNEPQFESDPVYDRRMGARQLLLETLSHVDKEKLLHDCDVELVETKAIRLADEHSLTASSGGSPQLVEVARTLATYVSTLDSPMH
jgi:hypothetical protein